MTLEIILAHTAIETYDAIFEQINLKFGKRAAEKFRSKVYKTLRLISKSPLIFKSTIENPYIRKGLITKNCSFFYKVSTTQVYILFFWDNRQDTLID